MKKLFLVPIIVCSLFFHAGAQSLPPEDSAEITQTITSYAEAWWSGDAARIEKSIHSELAKRLVYLDPKDSTVHLYQESAMSLVEQTDKGYGVTVPKNMQTEDIYIFDIYKYCATAELITGNFVDFLQLARYDK